METSQPSIWNHRKKNIVRLREGVGALLGVMVVYNGREDPEQIFQFEISCTDYSATGVCSGLLPMVHFKGRSSMAIAIAVISQHTPARLTAYPIY
jgi:hypothetical protein